MNKPHLNLVKGDSPVVENPANSFTLPARFYFDTDIYELEKERIFYKNWWYAGHCSQLANAGDYLTTQIHQQNVFIVRDRSGDLRAYYNVCQHRGHELLSGSGKTNVIVCPYHAWAYDFDGTLKAARNTGDMESFNKCDFSLKAVRVEQFCGMVFVNLDEDARAMADQYVQLEDEIRSFCPTVDDLQYAQRDVYDVESNWKTMIDNFLECYHCHTAHHDFVDLVDMESYRSRAKGQYSSHISGAARTTESNAFHFEKGDVDFGYAGWYLWPNTTIWAYPGEPNLSVLQMTPAGSERTLEYQDWFLPTTTPSKQIEAAMVYQKDVLQPEDVGLCESVQRGLHSRGYNQGRFVVDEGRTELSEHAVHHFQQMVVEALDAKLDQGIS